MPKTFRISASRKREILFLLILLVTLFVLFNQLSISRNRWTLHPDDHDLFIFSDVLLHTGHLWYESPLNTEYHTDAFRPPLTDYESDSAEGVKIRARYTPGIYFLLGLGHIAGYRGPFVIVSIMGVLGVLFLYLLARELFDYKVAMMSAIFLGFSSSYIMWSNMLWSNIPAVSLFLGGMYFLAMAARHCQRRAYYLASVAFFALSIWIRYEFIALAAVVILVVVVKYRHRLRMKYILQAALLALVIGGIFAGLNYLTTETIFGLHPSKGVGGTAKLMLVRYPTSIFGQRILRAISNNARMYIYDVAPVLTVLGLLGVVYCFRKKREGFLIALLLVGLLVLFYYGKSGSNWGYGQNLMASSYTRYFLPIMAALAIFAGVLTVRYLGEGLSRRAAVVVLALIVVAHVAVSVKIVQEKKFGLEYVDRYCEHRRDVNYFVAGLPEDAVIVDTSSNAFHYYMIISRTVFIPDLLFEDEREEKTVEIITDLVSRGIPVYIIDNPERSLFDIELLEARLSPVSLQDIEHPVIFRVGAKTPEIYQVVTDGQPGG